MEHGEPKMIALKQNDLDTLTPLMTLLQKQNPSVQMPTFNLKEFNSCYVLSIDLPNLQSHSLGIEVNKRKLQLVERNPSETIFFQYEPLGKTVKANYQDGILEVILPKAPPLTEVLNIPRLKQSLALS